ARRLATRVEQRRWWVGELGVLLPFAAAALIDRALVQTGHLPIWAANTLLCTTDWFAVGMLLAVASVAVERRSELPRSVRAVLEPAWLWWAAAAAVLLV